MRIPLAFQKFRNHHWRSAHYAAAGSAMKLNQAKLMMDPKVVSVGVAQHTLSRNQKHPQLRCAETLDMSL